MYFAIFSLLTASQTVLCAENNFGGYSYSRFRGPVSGAIQRIQVSAAALHDRLNAPQNSQLNKVDYVAKPDYHFEYAVVDPKTGNQQSHSEQRDGDTVVGQYSVVEPDGRLRVVQYTADAKNGFRVMIHYHGKSNTDDATTENSNNNALRHHETSQNNVNSQNEEFNRRNQFTIRRINNNRYVPHPGKTDNLSGTESHNNGRKQSNQGRNRHLSYPGFVLNHGEYNANNRNSDTGTDNNGRTQQNQGHYYLVVPSQRRESEKDDLNSGITSRGFEKSEQVVEPKQGWSENVKEDDKNGPVQFQNEDIQNDRDEVKEDGDYEENDEVESKKGELRDDDEEESEELTNYNDYEERDGELKNENDEQVEDYDE